jgi:hypothetical protein
MSLEAIGRMTIKIFVIIIISSNFIYRYIIRLGRLVRRSFVLTSIKSYTM